MIEYDKANVTSSYPSLTKYEVATILDKAYLALIARKLTGNNTRRVPFEYDVKAIEDLRPLITSKIVNTSTATTTASNELAFKLPGDLLYYLEGQASYTNDNSETADNKEHFNEIVNLVDHRTAQRFRATNTNMPWIKQPVSFLQGDDVYVLYDTYKHHDPLSLLVTYLEKPASFVASLVGTEDEPGGNPGGNEPGGDEPTQPTTQLSISIHRNDFEDDTKALIAATIVVENIEDQLYVDIFEKAETASQWTLLNTDTYDNNHTISWPVDITTYDKNVKFVIRNSNSTIKKESNVFTISSKPQTETTGNISRIQYNSADQNIEALCQLYNTRGIVLKYYIKPISASDQAYVLYGSYEDNFTTIIPYTGMWEYKKVEPGFVYKVELIDKITDSVLDTKTIVVPVESSDQTEDIPDNYVIDTGDVEYNETNKWYQIAVYAKNHKAWPYKWYKAPLNSNDWQEYREGTLTVNSTYAISYHNGSYGWISTGHIFVLDGDPYKLKFIVYNNDGSQVLYTSKEFIIQNRSNNSNAVFDFSNPTTLNPSITPSSSNGGTVALATYTLSDKNIRVTFGKTAEIDFPPTIWTYKNPYTEELEYHMRMTSGSTVTFSTTDNSTIETIVFQISGAQGNFGNLQLLDGQPGTFLDGTWNSNGSNSTSVTFRCGNNAARISKVTVSCR